MYFYSKCKGKIKYSTNNIKNLKIDISEINILSQKTIPSQETNIWNNTIFSLI